MTYYLSGSYFNNEATIKDNNNSDCLLRSNTKFTLSDKFSLNVIMSGTYNENDLFTQDIAIIVLFLLSLHTTVMVVLDSFTK